MIALESEQPTAASAAAAADKLATPPPPVPASQRTLTRSSAVSQKSVEVAVSSDGNPLNRSKLAPTRSASETQASGGRRVLNLRRTKNASIESTVSLPNQKSLDKRGGLRHQRAVQAQSDVTLPTQSSITDDRKTLRDALYQGIFSRHRRTIFAVGSFLRMLRTKNSNYDSIRSDSDEI